MTDIQRSALVPYTPAQMYALVVDIESYPDFLPWCAGAHILSVDGDEVRATIDIAKGVVHQSFTTCNQNQQDKMVLMRLEEGPFSHLEGFWRFDGLGDQGCKIILELEFDFASRMLSLVVGPVFTQIANSLVDSFQKRAREVYG